MKKSLLSALMLASLCANAQIIVSESFEGTALSAEYKSYRNADHSSIRIPYFGNNAGDACDGTKSISLNLYGTGAGSNNWYLVYSSTASNGTDLNYSFQYLAKSYNGTTKVDGSLDVEYSIDGGSTWINLVPSTTLSTGNGESIPCTTVSGVIPAANIPTGADFKFRIHSGSTAAGDFHMGLDNFKLQQAVTVAPDCTTITAPTNGETVNTTVPIIRYSSATNATEYKISIGTTPGGTDILDNASNGMNLNYTVPASANLQYNTTYYTTVTATNSIGDATGCQTISFNTGMPLCPTVTAPSANATEQWPNLSITWNAVAGVTGYKINIGTTAGGTDILNEYDLGNVTTFQPTGLNYNTTYYYTVTAYAGAYASANCEERSFTTLAEPPANDNCATATEVTTFPYNFTQTDAENATNNGGFVSVCSSSMNDGVWYKFVGDGTEHTIAITDLDASFDAKIQVYSGNDCASLSCVGSKDEESAGVGETLTISTTAGTTYYVNIGYYSGWADEKEGNFTIDITKETLATTEVKNNAKAITITPNPFVDEVFFHGVDVKKVAVIDASGRTVKTVEVEKNSINLGGLKSGMYILLLTHKDGTTSTVKAIKK